MEPQQSVFLYSKYSPNCKRLTSLLQESGIDTSRLGLQFLCIDNDKVRQRIKQAEHFTIGSVPCILNIFPNGGAETYEGGHAFRWIETMLSQIAPPPPPRPVQRAPPPQQLPPPPVEIQPQIQSQPPPQMTQEQPPEQPPQPPPQQRRPKTRTRPQMRPIQEEEKEPGPPEPSVTSIEDIPTDDGEDGLGDRHRAARPMARLRKNRGNYEDNEDAFAGPRPDMRRAPQHATRTIQPTTANDPSSLRAKADAMMKDRALISQIKPVGRQLQNRP